MTPPYARDSSPPSAEGTADDRATLADADDPAAMRKHSVLVAGHATSLSLENAFWQEFKEIAARKGTPLNRQITEIDYRRPGNLSSAIRVFVLRELRAGR